MPLPIASSKRLAKSDALNTADEYAGKFGATIIAFYGAAAANILRTNNDE